MTSSPATKPRTFADLTPVEAFNVGRVVGAFPEAIRARRRDDDGSVYFITSTGRVMGVDELLAHARRLSNTL